MMKAEALKLIDDHKNQLLNPLDLLQWTWLRVLVNNISEEERELLLVRAEETLSR